MLSFSETRYLGTFSSETKSHVVDLGFPDKDCFSGRLRNENEIVKWNLTKLKDAPNLVSNQPERSTGRNSKPGRAKTIERAKYYSCSFSSTSRAQPEGTSKRPSYRPTRKVGCPAKRSQKLLFRSTVTVTHHNSHSGHGINELQT